MGWLKFLERNTHAGDRKEHPDSQLEISSALAKAAIWGMDQQMKDLSS